MYNVLYMKYKIISNIGFGGYSLNLFLQSLKLYKKKKWISKYLIWIYDTAQENQYNDTA